MFVYYVVLKINSRKDVYISKHCQLVCIYAYRREIIIKHIYMIWDFHSDDNDQMQCRLQLFRFNDTITSATAGPRTIVNVFNVMHGHHLIILVWVLVMVVVMAGGRGLPLSQRQKHVGTIHAAVHAHMPVQVA